MEYNQAKKANLSILSELGPLTASDVAEIRKVTASCASAQLGKLQCYGLVDRWKIQGKEFLYEITSRGLDRLEYLLDVERKRREDEIRRVFESVERCQVVREDEIRRVFENVELCEVVREPDVEDVFINVQRCPVNRFDEETFKQIAEIINRGEEDEPSG